MNTRRQITGTTPYRLSQPGSSFLCLVSFLQSFSFDILILYMLVIKRIFGFIFHKFITIWDMISDLNMDRDVEMYLANSLIPKLVTAHTLSLFMKKRPWWSLLLV